MTAEFNTAAPITAPLHLTVDVVELRSSAQGASLEQEQEESGDGPCYCCCCCCCGVEEQAAA